MAENGHDQGDKVHWKTVDDGYLAGVQVDHRVEPHPDGVVEIFQPVFLIHHRAHI